MTGGFNPSPQVFGDSENTVWEIFLNSLNTADGNALSDDVDSFNYAENLAASRVLVDLFSTNKRLSYQFDPNLMTDFLPRWETILGIFPGVNDTENHRRRVVVNKISNYGKAPTQQVVTDLLSAALGEVFVQIINSDWTIATQYIPGGGVVPGGATLLDGDWSSSTAYILILVQQPDTMTDDEFYKIVGDIDGLLEDILPVWVTFNWGRANSLGEAGFILDDEHNLDNEFFDV